MNRQNTIPLPRRLFLACRVLQILVAPVVFGLEILPAYPSSEKTTICYFFGSKECLINRSGSEIFILSILTSTVAWLGVCYWAIAYGSGRFYSSFAILATEGLIAMLWTAAIASYSVKLALIRAATQQWGIPILAIITTLSGAEWLLFLATFSILVKGFIQHRQERPSNHPNQRAVPSTANGASQTEPPRPTEFRHPAQPTQPTTPATNGSTNSASAQRLWQRWRVPLLSPLPAPSVANVIVNQNIRSPEPAELE